MLEPGTCPELSLHDDKMSPISSESWLDKSNSAKLPYRSKKQWICVCRKHIILFCFNGTNTICGREFWRRRIMGTNLGQQEVTQDDIEMLQEKVTQLEQAHPVPANIIISKDTRVLINGPNICGKTICLKAVGVAAIMAKAGPYVLCSEPARIPWFDTIFADIGDEKSLSQSLSTFSGHLRQISARYTTIQARSTSLSLVLLDEVGAELLTQILQREQLLGILVTPCHGMQYFDKVG